MAESEVAVSKGLGAATTAIVSTMANRADEPGFMNNLADLAAKSAAGSHPLDAIGALGALANRHRFDHRDWWMVVEPLWSQRL